MAVHNLVVALCTSPAMHKNMSLSARCEASLCGFICLDLFRMLAIQKALDLGLPRGATFMSGQTMWNLQGTALSTIAICCAKEKQWSPWDHGEGRITEAAVEQNFGHLRAQSSTAQLSCRAYWMAAARQSLKVGDQLNKAKHNFPDTRESGEDPLSAETFFGSSPNFCSALGCFGHPCIHFIVSALRLKLPQC